MRNTFTFRERETEMSGCKFEAAFKSMQNQTQKQKSGDAETNNYGNLKTTANVGRHHHDHDRDRDRDHDIHGAAKTMKKWRSGDQLEDHHKVYTLLQLIFWGPD